MTVRGDSMRGAGIFDGDVLLVDRAVKPAHGQIVVAVVHGDFTCKQLWLRGGQLKLKAANPTFADITPSEGQTVEIWGVVIASVRQFKHGKLGTSGPPIQVGQERQVTYQWERRLATSVIPPLKILALAARMVSTKRNRWTP